MQIVLCRHTQTDHNHGRIYSGQIDIGLNPTGRQQADTLADRIGALDGPAVGAILSSNLTRSAYLAEATGKRVGVTPVLAPALREVHIGRMAGLVREEALRRFTHERHRTASPVFDFRDIGGESATQVIERHLEFLVPAKRELERSGIERIVVVGHGTALRLLFCYTLGLIDQLHDQGEFQLVSW